MKIGIITIHNSPNYGACLQSFALYKYLKQQGHDVEIIDLHRPVAYRDYVPSKKYVAYRRKKQSKKNCVKSMVRSLFGIKPKVSNLYSEAALSKFTEFNSVIKLSRPYRGIDELYANPPKYDLYISGSDQLWNPTQIYCLEPYFLTFVPQGQGKKISFATSIGITELRENEENDFKTWLDSYDSICVREKQAQSLLQKLLPHKHIEQVADPTFLLSPDYWKSIAVMPAQKGYILVFTLQYNPTIINYCRKLGNESGLNIVVLGQIQPDCPDGSYESVKDAGPKEFLGYIANAEMVITDSFHCTVFSLILGAKNFYTYISPDNNRGSRIIDLLETYNLNDHFLNVDLNDDYYLLSSKVIDRDSVVLQINAEANRAASFLSQYL